MNDTRTKPYATDTRSAVLADLIEQLTARAQAGEILDAGLIADEQPEFAEDLRRLLPALGLLGELSRSRESLGLGIDGGEGVVGTLGDYRIVREVGRGGMGVVYEAEQISLHRRVALKVLPFAAIMDPRHLQRFKNEALAAASIDHPNVVKVYGVGCERGVHFIAMQYIDGRTLADLIRERRDGPAAPPIGGQDATRTYDAEPTGNKTTKSQKKPLTAPHTPVDREFIRRVAQWGIQAAEALEHAHSLGIVHRDIKPGNLLIDGQGKVYVADFGLAKVMSDPGVTTAGDMLGTLRYMSPEQAGAQHDLVDHRSDVYSLGVTLYELLTLTPAFDGVSRQDILTKVTGSDPASLRKLNRQIPRELDTVVLKSMEKDPSSRYQTAKELAKDLERFLADRPVQARPPMMAQRAARWARRNRAAVVAAAAFVLVTVSAVAGSVGWAARDRAERRADAERRIDDGLAEVESLHVRGKSSAAREVVGSLEPLLAGGGVSPDRADRVRAWRADLDMVDRLAEVRILHTAVRDGHFDNESADAAYSRAFREYGIDVEILDPLRAAELIRARPVRVEMAAALDSWADVRLAVRKADGQEWGKRLLEIALESDPDETRVRVRNALLKRDLVMLRGLADSPGVGDLPPTTLKTLGATLWAVGERKGTVSLLRKAQERYPDDFWINHWLGTRLIELDPPQFGEALRYLTAAAAISPLSPGARLNIGWVLDKQGRLAEAVVSFREAIRLDPMYAHAHNNLGYALKSSGDLPGAIAAYQEAIRLDRKYANAHNNLGNALGQSRDMPGSIAAYKEAIRLEPKVAMVHFNLGNALVDSGDLPGALAAYREAIRLDPKCANAHDNLGNALVDSRDLPGALAAFKEAIRLNPKYAGSHTNLGIALVDSGDVPGAIAAYKEAIRLDPKVAMVHFNLGNALVDSGDVPGAIAAYKEAIRLDPKVAMVHYNLGNALVQSPDLPGAITAYREAIRLDPKYANAHYNLGNALGRSGDVPGAIAAFKGAIRLDPKSALNHYSLGITLRGSGDLPGAIASYKEAIRLDPAYAEAYCSLGDALRQLGHFEESLIAYRRGHELGSTTKGWPYPSALWMELAERRVVLAERIPKIADGSGRPANLREMHELAEVALLRKRYTTSAKLYAEVLLEDQKLAKQLDGPRYNAACAAILAGSGRGEDSIKLGEDDQRKWRDQALRWLNAELVGFSTVANQPAAHPNVRRILAHWRADPDLGPIRDEAELKKLPEDEQAGWRKLWVEHAKLQARVALRAVAPPPRVKESH